MSEMILIFLLVVAGAFLVGRVYSDTWGGAVKWAWIAAVVFAVIANRTDANVWDKVWDKLWKYPPAAERQESLSHERTAGGDITEFGQQVSIAALLRQGRNDYRYNSRDRLSRGGHSPSDKPRVRHRGREIDINLLPGAAAGGYTSNVKRLIDSGANVNAKNANGWTPLHWAANGGHRETALVLVKAGADLYARTNDGKTPLDIAINVHGKESPIAFALRREMNPPPPFRQPSTPPRVRKRPKHPR